MHSQHGNGIVCGIVSDLKDPEGLGRVRVTYPHLADEQSYWARLVAPMAGSNRGTFFRPEVGDEVVVAQEHNDPRRSVILGSVWNKTDLPPPDDGQPAQNNWRFIVSRSGHVIKLDDTNGSERIEIESSSGQQRVIIDSAGAKIQVICDAGDVEVSAAGGNVSVSARNIDIKATASMNIEAQGPLTIKGATVSINP